MLHSSLDEREIRDYVIMAINESNWVELADPINSRRYDPLDYKIKSPDNTTGDQLPSNSITCSL